MTSQPKTITLIPSTPTSVNQDHIGIQLKNSKETAHSLLMGGDASNLGTHNMVDSIQSSDNLHKSLTYGNNTSKQICSAPITGGKGTRKRKRTRKRTRKRKCKCRRSCKCRGKCRGKCKCRKTRRRRKSYRKKRK
jgi:hypothetical protein